MSRMTAADLTWQEQADLNVSLIGVIVVLLAAGLPLLLL